MKLRILGDSLRLRITKTEARRLADGLPAKETTSFPGGARLTYVLEASARATEIGVSFTDHQLLVVLPFERARAWVLGEGISLSARLPLHRGGELTVLIEKDFACLKPRSGRVEDESDLFPNPNHSHGHCR